MRGAGYLWLLALGLGPALLGSCCSPPPPLGLLEGYIQEGPTRPPIPSARVTLRSPWGVFQVQSDAQGYYRLTLPQGTYTAEVEREGYAASRVEGLAVAKASRFDPILLPAFYSGWPKSAPSLYLEGVPAGSLLTPGQGVRIRAYGSLPIQKILVRLGNPPTLPLAASGQLVWNQTGDTGWFSLPPSLSTGPPGPTTLHVVAYDANNNRSHLLLPVRLGPSTGQGPATPPPLKAVAYTLSQPLQTLHLGERPPGLFVRLTWEPVPGALGHRLYRGERHLGQYPPFLGEAYDQGPDLWPGQEVCYRLETLVAAGPPLVSEACATPLPPLTLTLIEPQGTASPTPSFRVSVSPGPSGPLALRLVLYDLHTGSSVTLFPPSPTADTVIPWTGPPLVPGRTYTWGVYLAYATDSGEDPRAYSLAVDQAGQVLGLPLPSPTATFEVRP